MTLHDRRHRLPIPWLAVVACLAVGTTVVGVRAQGSGLRTTAVQGRIHLITGAGGNVAVQVGDDGIVLVDSGSAAMSGALLEAVRQVSPKPIQFLLNSGPQGDHVSGNAALRRAGVTFTGGNATAVGGVDVGAEVVAYETTLARVSSGSGGTLLLPQNAWPTQTFFADRMDLFVNDEPIELLYQPAAITDGDLIVHFRKSDVLVTGDIFRLDTYPQIDPMRGGSITGTIAALNRIIAITVPKMLQEGGTLVVPGHGRIGDESDVVEYRDMVTIVRDRVADMIADRMTLAQVQAARPSRDYDARFGAASGAWTTGVWIDAIYRELSTSAGQVSRRPTR